MTLRLATAQRRSRAAFKRERQDRGEVGRRALLDATPGVALDVGGALYASGTTKLLRASPLSPS